MARGPHPTSEALVTTTLELLQTRAPDQIQVVDVLKASGISHGSLYHHFADLGDLVEVAIVRDFSKYVDASTDSLRAIADTVQNRDELVVALARVTRQTQARSAAAHRMSRVQALALAGHQDRFRERLATEQDRLTAALAELVVFAQARGWFRTELDPTAVALFIQAYTLGHVIDDVAAVRIDEETWAGLIDDVILRTFIARE